MMSLKQKEQLNKEFSKIFAFIDKCELSDTSGAWRNKAHLFTLLVETHRVLIKENKSLAPKKVGKRLKHFYTLVDRAGHSEEGIEKENSRIVEYNAATLQGTNDRRGRITRGKILQAVINGEFMLGQ